VRQLSRKPFGIRRSDTRASCRARCRARLNPNDPPKRHERAVGQYAGPVSIEPSAEAPRASRRARRRARLESNPPPKHRERAIGQDAGPVSNQILPQSAASEPTGKTPGPSRIESSAEAPRVSRRARRQARLEPSADAIHERSIVQAVAAEPRTIRRSSRSRRAPPIPNRTPQIIRCESPNGGRAWKQGHWGSYSCIIIERRRRPRAPHLLRDYRETWLVRYYRHSDIDRTSQCHMSPCDP